jgi:hypothetical protein
MFGSIVLFFTCNIISAVTGCAQGYSDIFFLRVIKLLVWEARQLRDAYRRTTSYYPNP